MLELQLSDIALRALLAALTASLSSALVGVFLVLRRMPSIGAAIAHMCFAGALVARALRLAPLQGAAAFSFATALAAAHFREREGQAEAVLAAALGISSAIAALAISFSRGYAAVVYTYLVGDVLGCSSDEVALLVVTTALAASIIAVLYRGFKYSTLDPETAAAMGLRVRLFEYAIASMAAALLVVEMRVVGMILAQVYLVAPAAIAWELTHSFDRMVACSLALSSVFALTGFALALLLNLPVSATIGLVASAAYAAALALSPKRRGRCLPAFLRGRRRL